MSRPIFSALETPNQVRVISHNVADERFERFWLILGITTCNFAACTKAKELTENTYITIYENKMEYNYPCAVCCLCFCCTYDRHTVIYFDRDLVRRADKAGCCYPWATHNQCCPTCFDCCGESVILYGATACSQTGVVVPHQQACCPCRCWTELPGMSDAAAISQTIVKQQDIARAKAGAPGHISMHAS